MDSVPKCRSTAKSFISSQSWGYLSSFNCFSPPKLPSVVPLLQCWVHGSWCWKHSAFPFPAGHLCDWWFQWSGACDPVHTTEEVSRKEKQERKQPGNASANYKWETENGHVKILKNSKITPLSKWSCQHQSYKSRIMFQKSSSSFYRVRDKRMKNINCQQKSTSAGPSHIRHWNTVWILLCRFRHLIDVGWWKDLLDSSAVICPYFNSAHTKPMGQENPGWPSTLLTVLSRSSTNAYKECEVSSPGTPKLSSDCEPQKLDNKRYGVLQHLLWSYHPRTRNVYGSR